MCVWETVLRARGLSICMFICFRTCAYLNQQQQTGCSSSELHAEEGIKTIQWCDTQKNWCVYQRVHHSWQGEMGKKETNREKVKVRGRDRRRGGIVFRGVWFSDQCWGGRNAIFCGEYLTILLCTIPETEQVKHPRTAVSAEHQVSYSYVSLLYTSPTFTVKCWVLLISWGN